MSKAVDNHIERVDNDNLRETLESLDDHTDLSQLKTAFPEQESNLTAIEAIAQDKQKNSDQPNINEENLLTEKGKPDHASIFQTLNHEHHFIHFLSRQGDRTERILAYKDGYYQFGGAGLIKQRFQSILPSKVSTYHKNQVVDRAYDHRMGKKGSNGNTLYDNLVDLNSPEWKLNLRNGVLDVKTRELEDHCPDYKFTNQLPYDYEPDAEPELWLDFLNQVLPNSEQQIPKMQEWFGYALKHWDTDFEKAALLIGSTNSGKGVILSTFRAMLGQENVSQMSLKGIVDTPFGNQQLLGKMANINNDLNHHEISNTGTAKNAISGEDVTINEKDKPKFVAEPKAKHFYSANYPPRDKISDDAYYGRWLTFRVPNTIPREERDRKLRDKLEEEVPGILNWAIKGLERLEEQGHFTGERTPDEVKDLWRRFGDPSAVAYHHCLEYEQGSFVWKDTFYDLVEEYCEAIGEKPPTKNKVSRYVEKQKPAIETGRRSKNGRTKRAYVNLSLTKNARQKLLAEAE